MTRARPNDSASHPPNFLCIAVRRGRASQRPPIWPPLGTLFEQGRMDVLRVVSVADTVIALVPIVDVGQILWKRLAAVAQPDSVHGWDRPFWVIRYWNREAAAIEGATAKREEAGLDLAHA